MTNHEDRYVSTTSVRDSYRMTAESVFRQYAALNEVAVEKTGSFQHISNGDLLMAAAIVDLLDDVRRSLDEVAEAVSHIG